MIWLFWALLGLVFLMFIIATGILADPELAAQQWQDARARMAVRWAAWRERAALAGRLLVLLVDGGAH